MFAWTPHRTLLIGFVASLMFTLGCSNSGDESTSDADAGTSKPGSMASDKIAPVYTPQGTGDQAPPERVVADPAKVDSGPPQGFPLADANLNLDEEATGLQLRPDLTPEKLVLFLAGADKDLQMIATGHAGISDPRKARAEQKRIVQLKLEASRRLKEHADASEPQKIEGARGELQSLSSLASLGDVKSADVLEKLARENLMSNDENLASDSRLVLIGFAIEGVQNGKEGAPGEILELIEEIKAELPAMMVLGQARHVLEVQGHDTESKKVRDTIIELFAGSSDPMIAKMAAQFAGSVRFDEIDKLRAKVVAGEAPTDESWRTAVGTLIDESPDMITVQYLAGAALEFEAADADDLATATYEVMTARFNQPEEATTVEVKLANEARKARMDVIGEPFDPDLPAVDGDTLSMTEFKGKVVLVPFWASGFPDSMQVIPMLQDLREKHPDEVAIVGMNLDPVDTKLDPYLQDQLGFRSFRSATSSTTTVANPVAARFGVVSMPFVAIINQQGKIETIDFTGRKLAPTLERLLAP